MPLLLLPLLVRRGCATCTGAGTCLLVCLRGTPRLLPASPLPVSKPSIAAKLTSMLDEAQLQLSRSCCSLCLGLCVAVRKQGYTGIDHSVFEELLNPCPALDHRQLLL